MNYDYNGNLTFEQRIENVSNDITEYCPNITKSEAMLIATLEPPICTKVDDIIKFRRLFNIIFIKRNYDIFIKIICEMKKLDNTIDIIKNTLDMLCDYITNKSEFPRYEEIFN